MRRFLLALGLTAVLATAGCMNYKPHPGAINLLDSQAYDVLISTHAVIEQTKADLAGGAWSAGVASKVKTVLNTGVIPAYNELDNIYQAYHKAANPNDPGGAVQVAVSNVTSQTTALTAAKAGR